MCVNSDFIFEFFSSKVEYCRIAINCHSGYSKRRDLLGFIIVQAEIFRESLKVLEVEGTVDKTSFLAVLNKN